MKQLCLLKMQGIAYLTSEFGKIIGHSSTPVNILQSQTDTVFLFQTILSSNRKPHSTAIANLINLRKIVCNR